MPDHLNPINNITAYFKVFNGLRSMDDCSAYRSNGSLRQDIFQMSFNISWKRILLIYFNLAYLETNYANSL